MKRKAIKESWGIIVPSKFLHSAIQSWGPKPFFFAAKAIYIVDASQNSDLVNDLNNYFKAKACNDIGEFCGIVKSGLVLNLATSTPQLSSLLRQFTGGNITVFEGAEAARIWNLIDCLEAQALQREVFYQALNSAAEMIQIANSQGTEIFINDAFFKITNLKMGDRLGKSVYDVSPDGGMAHVLKYKVQVQNLRNNPKGTDVEFISNAGPIFVNGEFYGAVTVARDITELSRLSKELEESKLTVALLGKKLGQLASTRYTFEDIIGNNTQVNKIIDVAKRAAGRDLTVLIQGESGTGKEIFAHAIHNHSIRKRNPFIAVNCAAIPEQLMESEFFGYERGAFTSANARKLGMLDLSNTGTLFLDEIGEMSFNLQSKFLRVLQDKQFIRVGGSKPIQADFRIIAATNHDLSVLVRDGKFREDLFYRLNVISIVIPPLRERLDDLEDISNYIIRKIRNRVGGNIQELSTEALSTLMSYPWPGNVRELENVLERAVFLCQRRVIKREDICLPMVQVKVKDSDKEKDLITKYLQLYGDSVEGKKKVAHQLGVSLATLYNKMKFYNLSSYYRHSFKA